MERVNRNGNRYSHHKRFIKYGESDFKTGPIYYNFPAFGRNFNLRLEREDCFLSQQLTVEHVYSDTQRLSFAGDLGHCFHRGNLQGEPNSTAVFNLCDGLVSKIPFVAHFCESRAVTTPTTLLQRCIPRSLEYYFYLPAKSVILIPF